MDAAFLIEGRKPSGEEWAHFLATFHRERPSATSSIFAHLHDADGRTSYQVLADTALALLERCDARILDIGCGEGALLNVLAQQRPHAQLFGIDLAESDIAAAQARLASADLRAGDIATAPWPDGAFDVIFSHFVMPGVYDFRAAFASIRRMLGKGALFALVVPDPNRAASLAPYYAAAFAAAKHLYPSFGLRLVDEDAMRPLPEILEMSGFTVLDQLDFDVSAPWNRDFVEHAIRTAYPFGAIDEEALLSGIRLFLPQNKSERITVPLSLMLTRPR